MLSASTLTGSAFRGAFGYIFAHDARPEYRLELISIAQAESKQRAIAQTTGVYPSEGLGHSVIVSM